MSHALYTTEAIVLGSRNSAEANRFVTLFTYDHGLIRAVAQGVRLLRSKLRYRLYTGARVRVTLVRGREVWRLVGVEEIARPETMLAFPERFALFVRVSSVVTRFVQGEEVDLELFHELSTLWELLQKKETEQLVLIEVVAVARLLSLLGYLQSVGEATDQLFDPLAFEKEGPVAPHEAALVELINKTLTRVHL